MPDLDRFVDAMRSDVSRSNWPGPPQIRAAGDRRRMHVRVATTVSVAVAVVAVVSAFLVAPHGSPGPDSTSGPAGTDTAPPTMTTPSLTTPSMTTPTTIATAQPIPDVVLLTTDDVAPTFSGVDTFVAPYTPNPFLGCGIDGLPGADQSIAGVGAAFRGGDILGGESVLRFEPGGAQRAMNAIRDLTSNQCTGFTVTDLSGGDEGLLLTTTEPGIIVPEAAHGVALAYAIVRYSDYLVWITLIGQTPGPAPTQLATTLVARAGPRLCAEAGC